MISIISLPGYKLDISFEDGVSGIIDLETFVQNGIFSVLKDEPLFSKVKFNQSAIFWNEELEIDLLNIYLQLSYRAKNDL